MNGRKILDIEYSKGKFRIGELTVENYIALLQGDEYGIEKILLEFNEKIPKLTEHESKNLMGVLFQYEDNLEELFKKKSKKTKDPLFDFHIRIGIMMSKLHQQYSEIMKMPLKMYNSLWEDMEILIGLKEYDKNRNKTTLDSRGLMQVTGGKKVLSK